MNSACLSSMLCLIPLPGNLWIWKLEVPSRLKNFKWINMDGKLFTNVGYKNKIKKILNNVPRKKIEVMPTPFVVRIEKTWNNGFQLATVYQVPNPGLSYRCAHLYLNAIPRFWRAMWTTGPSKRWDGLHALVGRLSLWKLYTQFKSLNYYVEKSWHCFISTDRYPFYTQAM